jgi:hypothetical protein
LEAQSAGKAPLKIFMWKESVDALLKVVDFLRVLRFPAVDRVAQEMHVKQLQEIRLNEDLLLKP